MSHDDRMNGPPGERPGECSATGPISCAEALERVNEFLDGELEGVAPEVIRAHFEACARCYPHLRFEQSFRKALCRALSREKAPPELRARLRTLIDEAARQG